MTCCAATSPPTAAAYSRHIRGGTVPCQQSAKDSAAYRKARKALANDRLASTKKELEE